MSARTSSSSQDRVRGTNGIRVPRVLIVEDEHLIQLMLAEMVSQIGYEVAGTAANLDEAKERAAGLDVDLAVLDVNLGGEKVFPVADTLRGRAVPFCFVTGYGVAGVPEQYRLNPIIQKPFQETDLARVLRTLCAPNRDAQHRLERR